MVVDVVGGKRQELDSTLFKAWQHQRDHTRIERRNDDERKYDLLFESFAAIHPFSALAGFHNLFGHCKCSCARKPATPQECIIEALFNNRARRQGRERGCRGTSFEAYVSRTAPR